MQALYAYFQTEHNDVPKAEKNLLSGLNKMYEYYLYELLLLTELADIAQETLSDEKQKYFPSQPEIEKLTRFSEIKTFRFLSENSTFAANIKSRKLSWATDKEILTRVFSEIRKSPEYESFVSKDSNELKDEHDFLIQVFKKYVTESYYVQHLFSEKNIYWIDDAELVNSMVIKTIKTIDSSSADFLLPLFKDEEEDMVFVKELFRKTILHDNEYERIISEKTKNWDVERIALLDIILMKLALSEIINFPNIPIKVSINEYIDISKEYSTPKSRVFINGVIDKLVIDLKKEGKIKKSGRGLIE